MPRPDLEKLVERLDVQPTAFRVGRLDPGAVATCYPAEHGTILVPFHGEGALAWNGSRRPLERGTVVVVPPRTSYQLIGPLAVGSASVRVTLGDGIGLLDRLDAPLFERPDEPVLPGLLAAMEAEVERPGIGTTQIVTAMIKQLIIILLRAQPVRPAHGFAARPLTHPQLDRALLAITGRPQDAHSVDSLAREAGMSRSRFTHHFTEAVGRSPMEFVQSVRLGAAARLLRETDRPIKLVAASVGYASRSHFSRAFRREYGVDPSGFRESPGAEFSNERLTMAGHA